MADFGRYEAAVAAVRAKLVAYAATVWAAAGVDDAAMEMLLGLIVPKVLAGQLQVANLTAAYFGQQLGVPVTVPAAAVAQVRGVDPKEVYQRPLVTTRAELALGKTFEAAKRAGGRRLESLVTTDLQLAKTQQADRSLQAAGVQRYRRVVKGSHTCAMCLIASTQVYYVGKLLPIHPGCDCGIDTLPVGVDLDEAFDTDRLLEATHAKVEEFTGIADRGGRAPDYRKLLITHDHGELGEVLAYRNAGGSKPTRENRGSHTGMVVAKKHQTTSAPRPSTAGGGGAPPPSGGGGMPPTGGDFDPLGPHGPSDWEKFLQHAMDRHASGRNQPGETEFRPGFTRDDLDELVRDVASRPRVTADRADAKAAAERRRALDEGRVTLVEQRANWVNLYAARDGARYEIRVHGNRSTAHPVDGAGISRINKKTGAPEALNWGDRPIQGWDTASSERPGG